MLLLVTLSARQFVCPSVRLSIWHAVQYRLAREGRFEFVQGGWVQTDEANTHYFAMFNEMLDGHDWLKKNIPGLQLNYSGSCSRSIYTNHPLLIAIELLSCKIILPKWSRKKGLYFEILFVFVFISITCFQKRCQSLVGRLILSVYLRLWVMWTSYSA